jgi:hypothetical protein
MSDAFGVFTTSRKVPSKLMPSPLRTSSLECLFFGPEYSLWKLIDIPVNFTTLTMSLGNVSRHFCALQGAEYCAFNCLHTLVKEESDFVQMNADSNCKQLIMLTFVSNSPSFLHEIHTQVPPPL